MKNIKETLGCLIVAIIIIASFIFMTLALSGGLSQEKDLEKLGISPEVGQIYYIPFREELGDGVMVGEGMFWYEGKVTKILNDSVFYECQGVQFKDPMDRFRKMATKERGADIF